MYNTPPTYTIYIMGLVYKWLIKNGGLETMQKVNEAKAKLLYDAKDRSLMNVTFNLQSEELEKKFIAEAAQKDFIGIKGHRSVGGVRASIYNAFPTQGVADLVELMKNFKNNN